MNYSEGSLSRKWDLHVHTPESIGHQYGAGGKDPWQAFLSDLESLPPEIKVIGVNDYIFIDGYKRLLKEKQQGRLNNLDLLLPVIELRLDKFGGSTGHLRRVNYHIIFSNELTPETIEQQFLHAISSKYVISPPYADVAKKWNAVPTRDSLTELGSLIIESVPHSKRKDFKSPLEEGFNNLNFTLEGVQTALRHHYFPGRYLTAIGKTEWSEIKWNDNTIAEKKNLINDVDLVFISAGDEMHLQKTRESLVEASVNGRLLDCSDSHNLSSSSQKDRLGKCYTWIKADTTFRGLQHAVHEYENRVYLGLEPPKLARVRENQTKFISSLKFSREEKSALDEYWFHEVSITFNKDLVAIIGNKGSGKSALADTIGLLGNSRQEDSFSFLNPQRFRDPRDNKASSFTATVKWESGAVVTRNLNQTVSAESVELVKYIPQHFLESVCNDMPGGLETSFDKEVKKVIFSHVSKADRLGHDSIDAVILDRTTAAYSAISQLKIELEDINDLVVECEHKNTREYRETIQNKLDAKKGELEAHEKQKPTEITKPEADPLQKERLEALSREISDCRTRIQALNEEIENKSHELDRCVRQIVDIDKVSGLVEVFRRQLDSLRRECKPLLESLDINMDSIVKTKIDTNPLMEKKSALQHTTNAIESYLDPVNQEGPVFKTNQLTEKVQGLELQLDKPHKDYQQYSESLRRWKEKYAQILGDETGPDTIRFYEKHLAELTTIVVKLTGLRNQRRDIVREIHREIVKLVRCYRDLYEPVQRFIQEHTLTKETVPLVFEVSIVNKNFEVGFLEKINQRIAGSFQGVDDGLRLVRDILARHDFNTEEGTISFLNEVLDHLEHDKRPSVEGEGRRIADQLKKGFAPRDLHNFIFSLEYLDPRYVLKLGDKELHQLSPGEKGSLLLIFYLLVDKSDIPLILDQPDENIDQETVFSLLVPCIKEAKKFRQVFIVTHNPNLAVVCDAEQFVCCSLDKADKNRVSYKTGALENPDCNIKASTVLEGTLPAFDNRNVKYIRPS